MAVDLSTASRRDSSLHWASVPEAGLTIGLWLMYGCHALFGRAPFRALMWPVSWYYIAVRPAARRASIEYLTRLGVMPTGAGVWRQWRAAAQHVRSFADVLLDKALVWTGGLDLDATRYEVDPRFDDAVARNRGGVLVVAHFGNLEVLRRIGERAKALRLHILVHTKHAERFNRMLTRMNPQSAKRLLQVTEVDAATIAHLTTRVEMGDFVVIAADRVPVATARASDERRAGPSSSRAPTGGARAATGGERVIDVPFLGMPAPFPVGPWVLASALGCPVYWLACYRRAAEHDRYTLVCELLHHRVELPRATRQTALAAVIGDYARRVERACREAPLSWFNFYPFWRRP